MKRSKFSDGQILAIVREGEAGRKVADLCRLHGITQQTYYRWKAKYGGTELSEMQRLKADRERVRRKLLYSALADQTPHHFAMTTVGARRLAPARLQEDLNPEGLSV